MGYFNCLTVTLIMLHILGRFCFLPSFAHSTAFFLVRNTLMVSAVCIRNGYPFSSIIAQYLKGDNFIISHLLDPARIGSPKMALLCVAPQPIRAKVISALRNINIFPVPAKARKYRPPCFSFLKPPLFLQKNSYLHDSGKCVLAPGYSLAFSDMLCGEVCPIHLLLLPADIVQPLPS